MRLNCLLPLLLLLPLSACAQAEPTKDLRYFLNNVEAVSDEINRCKALPEAEALATEHCQFASWISDNTKAAEKLKQSDNPDAIKQLIDDEVLVRTEYVRCLPALYNEAFAIDDSCQLAIDAFAVYLQQLFGDTPMTAAPANAYGRKWGTSKIVDSKTIKAIKQNIAKLHPKATDKLKLHILDVAISAIEDLVFIEGGSFIMGDFEAPCVNDDLRLLVWQPNVDKQCYTGMFAVKTGAADRHKVTLSSYSLSKYETTYHGFDAFRLTHGEKVIEHDRRIKYQHSPAKFADKRTPTKDWQEVKNYCLWLGELTQLPFDLPTEAQWEFAARNRGQNLYYATNNGFRITGHPYNQTANLYFRVEDETQWNIRDNRIGGESPPNPLGLFDMTGSAMEWTNDWYSPDYYKNSPEHDPQGPESGEVKVMRGGNYRQSLPYTTNRYTFRELTPKEYHPSYGFRCALQQDTPAF